MRPLASDILVAIISGGRPDNRPTEKYELDGYWCIISNNSEGYETDIDIINVPDDFREYYRANWALSDFGMKVPMNRSYAIKYASEQGYRYLIQLDDNISGWDMCCLTKRGGVRQVYKRINNITPFMNALADVLRFTNAGMSGLNLAAMQPEKSTNLLSERYVYSVLCLDLDRVPYFYGDVEEDIAMRYQLAQQKIPVAQIIPFRYSKTGQRSSKDTSGNRAMYDKMGSERGANMAKLYGAFYARGEANMTRNVTRGGGGRRIAEAIFKHKVKPFKVGLKTTNNKALRDALALAIAEVKLLP